MLVLPQKIELKWANKIKKYYENKGYLWTKRGDIFFVNVLDLPENSNKYVKVRCDYCGKIYDCIYQNYKKRQKDEKHCCINCIGKKSSEKYKETIKNDLFPKIKIAFSQRNYLLLGNYEDYKNNESRLKYICLKHRDKGILKISWANFQTGYGCKYCGFESISKNKTLDYEFVKNEFNKRNYILLETEYINAKTQMRYICPNHSDDVQTIMYTNFKKGHGCHKCANESISGENNYGWKGGITPLHEYLRKCLNSWKKSSIENCNNRCVITGDMSCDIHHLYSFSLILKEALNITNLDIRSEISKYTNDELKLLKKTCIELHYKYPLGVCLREDIHALFHSIYGYGDNTPDQFYEFKNRFLRGEFNGVA